MELIQFKSINGRKFPNLKVVWAAINPDDHEVHTYDVEPLDPAQKDRFHVHIKMNNDLCRDFFIKKFGVAWTESAFDWWNNLPEKTKDNISPRRLEYALDIYTEDGDISDVLPEACLPKKLTQALSHGSPKQKFLKILESEDTKLLENFLNDFSNINSVITIMESEERIALKCLKYIPKEALVFGRHGGKDSFSLPFAKDAIVDSLSKRDDIYFLFLNTEVFINHPRVIHIGWSPDFELKSKLFLILTLFVNHFVLKFLLTSISSISHPENFLPSIFNVFCIELIHLVDLFFFI
jgi:hypothetical protein